MELEATEVTPWLQWVLPVGFAGDPEITHGRPEVAPWLQWIPPAGFAGDRGRPPGSSPPAGTARSPLVGATIRHFSRRLVVPDLMDVVPSH